MKEPSTLQFTLWSCGLADEVPEQALTYCHILHQFRPCTCPLAHRDILRFEEKPSQNGGVRFLFESCLFNILFNVQPFLFTFILIIIFVFKTFSLQF